MPDSIASTMPACAARSPSFSRTEGMLVVPIASVTRRKTDEEFDLHRQPDLRLIILEAWPGVS